jgi:polysaccharide export outer membrane protein
MLRHLTLIDALTMAGGASRDAGGDVIVHHKASGADEEKTTRISLKELLDEGRMALNIAIGDGDVITVPERIRHVYYVIGEVGRPGAYDLRPDGPTLLSQAIANAGGPAKTAKASKGVLVRQEANRPRQELRVNFQAVLKGKQPDTPIRPNDIIFVPGSKVKDISYGLLGVVPQSISRVPYLLY